MQRKMNKRRKRAQLTFVYFLMTSAVVASLVILLLIIQGYRFNRFDGRVEQGGLVQFDSRPTGADVMLDKVRLANKTPSKITATAGQHTVTMSKEGYGTWQKDVAVKPGGVLWLSYARMLPLKLKSTTVHTASDISSLVSSPDKRRIAFVAAATDPVLTVIDANDPAAAKVVIELPLTSYTSPADGVPQAFSVQAWSYDGRSLLVKHTAGDRTEYLSVDARTGGETRNISTLLGVQARDVQFSFADSNTLFVLTDTNELRQANLADRTLSGPLVGNVATMSLFDRSTIVFETLLDASSTRHVGYLTLGTGAPKIVQSHADDGSTPFKLRFGRYYNVNYALVSYGNQTEIMRGELPSSDTKAMLNWKRVALFETAGAAYAGFSSGENRFAYVQQGDTVDTYDLELLARATITLPAPNDRAIDWLDGHHIVTSSAGRVAFVDFDGTNGQTLALANARNLPTILSSNGKYYYHVASAPEGASIIRTNALVE